MAIQFPCGNCGALIEVDDHYAGGQCECPACNAMVAIPHESAPESAPRVSQPPPPPPSPSAPQPETPAPMPRMSPPTEPGRLIPPTEPGRKGWAVAALTFAILGFCLPPLGLVAIVCGIVALAKIGNNPQEYGGKGLAISGIVIGSIALVFLILWALVLSIMLPSLARARELSKRAVCAANLKGMATAFYTYANENNDIWPSPFDAEGKLIPAGGVDYVGAIGSYRGKAGDPDAGDITRMAEIPDKLSTTRGPWMLIRDQISTPKSFICPSGIDMPNTDASPQAYWDFGVGDITGPANPGQVRQGWRQMSYGYQVPFGKHGRPSSDCDMRMPLAADKGPFGGALDGGLASPPNIAADGRSSPEQWRLWNSPNHGGQGGGEGQNVLYTDAHVDWASTPVVGVNKDNIYTQWSGQDALGKSQGNRPTAGGKQTPAGDTDTLIYP